MYSAKLAAVHNGSSRITVAHLREAATLTRPSVSDADRARFLAVYRTFQGEDQDPQSAGGGGGSGGGRKQDDTQAQALLGKLAQFGYNASSKRLATG